MNVRPKSSLDESSSPRWRRRTIGPDVRYNDDFAYDRRPAADPLFNRQYGRLLDQRKQSSSTANAEDMSQAKSSSPPSASVSVSSSGAPAHPRRRTLKEEGRSVTWHADKFKEAMLHVMETRRGGEVLLTVEGGSDERDMASVAKRHPDHKMAWSPAKAFQELRRAKEAPPKNLVQRRLHSFEHENEGETSERRSRALPKESTTTSSSRPSTDDHPMPNLSPLATALQDDVFHEAKHLIAEQKAKRREFFEENTAKKKSGEGDNNNSDNGDGSSRDGDGKERKRSVKDLLSDFERKSAALLQQEAESLTAHSELSDSRRRVCSDTETMNYDDASSSDEVEDDRTPGEGRDDPSPPPPKRLVREDSCSTMIVNETDGDSTDNGLLVDIVESTKQSHPKEERVPELPPRTAKSAQPATVDGPTVVRTATEASQYLTMTPPKPSEAHYLPMAPSQPSTLAESRNSLASSRGSMSAATGIVGVGWTGGGPPPPTPSEMLVAALAADHARTPSQTLVIEHLQGQGKNFEDVYVERSDEGSFTPSLEHLSSSQSLAVPRPQPQPHLPAESPRYCEIDDEQQHPNATSPPSKTPQMAAAVAEASPSHYEYLFKARSATPLHYEVVYQEIQDDEEEQREAMAAASVVVASPIKSQRTREKLRPPPLPRSAAAAAGLPDIVGDSPVLLARGGHYSSSDADDDGPGQRSAAATPSLSSSFIPASFYLDQSPRRKTMSHERLTDDRFRHGSSSAAMTIGSYGNLNVVEEDPTMRHRHPRERARPASTTPVRAVTRWNEDMRLPRSPPPLVPLPDGGAGGGGLRGSVSSADSRRSSRNHLEEIREEGRRAAPMPPSAGPMTSAAVASSLVDLNEEGEQLEQLSVPPTRRRTPTTPTTAPHSRQASAAGNPSVTATRTPVVAAPYYVSDVASAEVVIDYGNDEQGAGESLAEVAGGYRGRSAPHPVPRAHSLEGLLGDYPGGPRDSVEVTTLGAGEAPFPSMPTASAVPARGATTAPWEYPEAGGNVYDQEDEESWRQSLRRASARQRARSVEPGWIPESSVAHLRRPAAMPSAEISPRLSDYVWDETGQRFYRLRSSSSSVSAGTANPSVASPTSAISANPHFGSSSPSP
jgi:hypothetical protein